MAKPSPERPSIERLFETEESPLLGFAHGFVRRREIAEELVQEAFIRVHAHWDEVENPRAWIYRATRNLCLSWLRKHKRETEMDEEQQANTTDPDTPAPDSDVARLEAIGSLRAHLADLPEIDRQLIHLKYTEDLRYKQIADQTGLTVGNVGYRLHHILKSLSVSMNSQGFGHHSNQ